jgi:hypothetical protein
MKTTLLAMTVMLSVGPAGAEDPAASLTRGKLEADLGHPASAAEAFSAVLGAREATTEQRWEALVRLGVARREAGDTRGSVEAFEEAWRTYGRDPEALHFLLPALGSALPGRDRWEKVWSKVTVEFDRADPENPTPQVRWPGVEPSLCPCSGEPPVDLDFTDGSYNDILRLMADVTGENVVVNPGVQGLVTVRLEHTPWDAALETMLAPNGYVAVHEGNVIAVGRPGEVPKKRGFTGGPIDFEYRDADLGQVLRQVAAYGGAKVEVPKGVAGRVTFKLVEVPWDQAFDLLVHVNGLTWTREGDVIRIEPRRSSGE